MTDYQLMELLQAIRRLAFIPYPFTGYAEAHDPDLVLALGQIAGIADKAIEAVKKQAIEMAAAADEDSYYGIEGESND